MTPRATHGRVLPAITALAAAIVLSSCGSTVDSADAEKQAAKSIPGLAESELAVDSVTCPEDVDYVKGTSFDCDYTVEDGTKGVVTVDITSDDKSSYSISSYASGQVADYLLNTQESDVPLASVECDDPVEDGSTCTFEDEDGDTGTIALTFDDEGNYQSVAEYD